MASIPRSQSRGGSVPVHPCRRKTPVTRFYLTVLAAFHVVFAALLALAGGSVRAATDSRYAAQSDRLTAPVVAALPTSLIVGVLASGPPPLEMMDGERLTGFSADYLRLVAGPGVELRARVFADVRTLLIAACKGQIDVIMNLERELPRERCLAFTVPYLGAGGAFVTRVGNEGAVTSPVRLAHARIAMQKDDPLERVLHERLPEAGILTYATLPDALAAVSAGAADAGAGLVPAMRYALAPGVFGDLRIAREERVRQSDLRFAVPVPKQALRDRLNMALARVRPADAGALRVRWLVDDAAPPARPRVRAFALGEDERRWLRALPALKVGVEADTSNTPNTRQPAGLVDDYLDYLTRVLGVKFEEVRVSTWPDTTDPFHRGELAMLAMSVHDEAVSFAVRPDLIPLVALIDRALEVMPDAERQRSHSRWGAPPPPRGGGWSVNAQRLLPFVIVIGIVLFMTLRAYALLEREMHRRERAEQILARHVELQDTMMEMIPYPFGARDMEGRYIAVNRAYEEATGLHRAHVIGRGGQTVQAWGAENSRRVDELYERAIRDGGNQRIELLWDGPAGDARYGIFWTRLCRDAQGAPVCVLGTMIDITEIRRAELRARETERLLFDVTRSLPALVFQLRRAPDGTYAFPYLGGDVPRFFGDDARQMVRPVAADLMRVYPRDRARLFARLERSAWRQRPVHIEFRYHGSPDPVWVRAEFVPRRESESQGGAVVWSGYAVDANIEHARADELARARDLAEAASRAKDEFLAMMSHEIRTPMNGVLGLVEVLERTQLNPDQMQMITMVQESAGALLQILDDLLDYAKIQAGRLDIVSEPFDVRELVDNAVGLLVGRAHEKGLKVRIGVAPDVAATLRGDSVRLRQILLNLISNAIKFTPRGEVSVSVSSEDLPDTDAGARQRLSLRVADTGIGIDPEAQARLFEPFIQVESTTTRRFGGTGLGLTICRRLTALMGGALALRSERDRGTELTLQVDLPVEERSAAVPRLRGKRALVVCDDARVVAALCDFGTALGMSMMSAVRADIETGDFVAWPRPDLVLMCESCAGFVESLDAAAISLTDWPEPTGYRVTGSSVSVSVNPLTWRGLAAACLSAFAGRPAEPARPVAAPASVLAAPDRERELAAGRLILVAEDHAVSRALITHQLALLGFACDVVDDGEQALAAFAQYRYGCLITDCHMPIMSGHDLARRVRQIERERGDDRHDRNRRRLPILATTANTAPETLQLCRDAGMDGCIIKPTRVAALREHLVRLFGESGVNLATPDVRARTAWPSAAVMAAGPFAPLDLPRMIQVWGSKDKVKTLLGTFVSTVRADLDALAPLVEPVDIIRLREWHHRLAGAVGVLQYPTLLNLMEAYRNRIDAYKRHTNRRTAARLRAGARTFVRRCSAVLDSIERQAATLG